MFPHVTQRSVTSAARIQPPETFDFSTPNEWPKWKKRFERYLVVSGMKKKEEADKIDLFMYLMGDRADDIFRTFKFEKEEEATKIDSVLKAFDSHFCVRKNIIYERAKFNSRIQEDREPVDEFITSLYKLADSCEFEGLHEQLIRDRIVVGVRDKALSERMQLDSELTLEKAVKMVRQQEAVRQQQVDLQRPSTSQKVNQVKFNSKKQSPKQQQQPSRKKEKSAKTRSRCPKCGGFTHREGQACRAEGQKCNLCSKTGHFANCCPDKQAKTAEVKAVSELDEEIGFLLEVSAVEDSSNLDDDEGECRRRWTAEIQVNGKRVKFKLDSQADVTCVPLCLFKKIMGQQRLVESDINLRAAEFSELQTVGMFISTLRNGNYEIKEKIYVIRRLIEPLLSRRACELLNLARRIEVVATRINPIKEFPEVFEGLGQIGNPYEIKLKPGAKPYAVHTPRRVPIPLMEKLKTRLEELDKDQILTKIFEAQQQDTTLKAVVNYLEKGWPDKKKMSQALLSYWHVKDELGVQNGLLMRSCRLVIPASMKLEILDKLHAGHFGITKTRLRARETVWWPGISEEIAETVRKCSVCIQEAVSKHEPLIPTNFPTRPWQKIGMDLFKFENKWYLVVIDYYSRFPEMVQLDRLTASVVMRSCKSIFARHGIPETVVSDNGTQFGAAREFENFARQYGFQHVTSSPRFPQSNGMAEAGVKIAKLILKKNQDPSLGLLEYRSTPLENGYSPAELLMGRKLRTTLPIAPENLNPRLVDSQTLKRKEGRRRKDMKSRYDRRCGATDMEELSEAKRDLGCTVYVVQAMMIIMAMIIMQFDFAFTNARAPFELAKLLDRALRKPSTIMLVLDELHPRRRLQEEQILIESDFLGTSNEFAFVLERTQKRDDVSGDDVC
ncbi:K02A2.6-like [Cordylochernes scorpioides]|uniref:RNA-directed DNA polymerase n=1 Tax=Cordylochernes scorpioides TaxID=51811 RepID=A0ABY6KUK4_9ARAC|nr:K02A2.6-like [Cordylochernes scorpioides]